MERKKYLQTPLTEEQVRDLKVGDIVYLNGTVVQMRSPAHARAVEYLSEEKKLPFELENGVIYHAYSCNIQEKDEWSLCYIGPTLSYRMSKYAPILISKAGVRAFIGKAGGGMSEETLQTMSKFGCVYLSQVGGVTAYNTSKISKLTNVYWEDLGLDRVVTYKVKDLGPLIVTMDTSGENLFLKQHQAQTDNLKQLLK